jgi:signal transduction histidine kinase
MKRRTTLGAGLARWIALSSALSIAVYAATAALAFWLDETYEDNADDNEPPGFDQEDAAELLTQAVVSLAIAAPVGILLSAVGARWLTVRATRRIDEVIATAARVSADDLRARLPISPRDDELDALARALNALFARVDAGIADQRQFAADASHELRSPLAVVASTLEIALRRPRSPAEWETLARRALAEVHHMTALVDGLLQLARAGTLRRVRADLATAIDPALARVASLAADAGVRLTSELPQDAVAEHDPGLLDIAVSNLLANAIAHTPAGGTVHLHLERSAAAWSLHVDDCGPGVPLADRQRIFAPFVRASAETADRTASRAGLGLGLAIVHRIAEAHGGRVAVGDAPGGGARFTLDLPAAALS